MAIYTKMSTQDPGLNDDLAHGFPKGSTWLTQPGGTVWISVNSTNGAAVWAVWDPESGDNFIELE